MESVTPWELFFTMLHHSKIDNLTLRSKIRCGEITLAGNRKLKIYGKLNCSSGKRMKRGYRVFFASEQKAREWGYRPCGHCLKSEYSKWKSSAQ